MAYSSGGETYFLKLENGGGGGGDDAVAVVE